MSKNCVWLLPTFCQFYGKIIPTNNVGNDEFTMFHTSSRNCDDLYVKFSDTLKPTNFMGLLACSRSYYVVGSGGIEEDREGRCFYANYTLYDREGLETYLAANVFKHNIAYILEKLDKTDQAIIEIKPNVED